MHTTQPPPYPHRIQLEAIHNAAGAHCCLAAHLHKCGPARQHCMLTTLSGAAAAALPRPAYPNPPHGPAWQPHPPRPVQADG